MCLKPILGLPLIVTCYLILATACSAVWLYSFNLNIFESNPTPNDAVSTSTRHKTLLILLIAYVIHLPILVSLPFSSRPWLWKDGDNNKKPLRLLSRILGWDGWGEDHPLGCIVEGVRAVASFIVACAPFALFVNQGGSHGTVMAGILGLALEGFFAAEMVKHTEAEDGFFLCQMASATCAAQRVFGPGHWKWRLVFCVCLFLIFLHSYLPYYEDVFTLLPEPYLPGKLNGQPKNGDSAIEVVTVAPNQPPSAQVMLQNANANVVGVAAPVPAQESSPSNV